jgi:hypothetical protein
MNPAAMTAYLMRAAFVMDPDAAVRISADMTMDEVALRYPATRRLFVLCGFDAGCGPLPLDAVAERRHLDVSELLRALRMAAVTP